MTSARQNAAWPRLSANRKKLNPTFLAIALKAGFKAERIDDDDDVSVARDNGFSRMRRLAPSFKLRVKSIRSKDLMAVYIGSSYVWPRPARSVCPGQANARGRRTGFCLASDGAGSYKGRGGNSGSDPVPVGDDVIEVLCPQSPGGQAMHLFSSDGSMNRSRGVSRGRSLNAVRGKEAGCVPGRKAIRERAGVPEVIPMLFGTRASCAVSERACPSTGRQLHNTSVKMIERHYAEIRTEAHEEPRKGGSRVPGAASDGSVVPMGKQRVRDHPAVLIEFIRLMAPNLGHRFCHLMRSLLVMLKA